MEPIPGGVLEDLNELLSDPTIQIVAHLAKSPRVTMPDVITLGTLVECDFPGYTPYVYTPNLTTALEEEFYGEMGVYNVEFPVGAIVTPQPITAIYVTEQKDGEDPGLVSVAVFDPPLLAHEAGQVFSFDGTLAAFTPIDD